MKKKTLVIAEAGVNHNGDMTLAKKLISAAAEAGADLVKFQTFSADRLVTAGAKKADYQSRLTSGEESQLQMLRQLELDSQMHHVLALHCAEVGIGFFSTGYDIESINFLLKIGQNQFKIPSGEITNLPYLRHIGSFRKRVFLSTGMATLGDIEAAIDVLEKAGTDRKKMVVLHCTTEYPTPMEEVNLRAMVNIGNAFGVAVGYSDHTLGIEISIAAAAMGAEVIEKHFTLDRNLPGPDHKASLEPYELRALITAIRNVDCALGDGVKRPTLSEIRNQSFVRKSLVASLPIACGEVFTEANLVAKRPGTGVSPMRWDDALGRVALRDYSVDQQIDL